MDTLVTVSALADDPAWETLVASIPQGGKVPALSEILELFRDLGAGSVISEGRYIDRDFSAAYAAFYAALFEPHLKYCRRLHFFEGDISPAVSSTDPSEIALNIEATAPDYLGYVVLRPVLHAPVGAAIVSADHFVAKGRGEVSVKSSYAVHLLGAELTIQGIPVTAQDSRVGACAQSAIWTIGRHFTSKHGSPWFSLPEITELALVPTDSFISRSLPIGSEYLTPDNMVRALRAMDRHPVVYARSDFSDPTSWPQPPAEIVHRYLDSGIPVIIGLAPTPPNSIGHAVVAVGHKLEPAFDPALLKERPTPAAEISDFLVNDDQRGVYRYLPNLSSRKDYPWSLSEHCLYLIVPLPSKVFFKADVAEALARIYLANVVRQRADICNATGLESTTLEPVPDDFQLAMDGDLLVGRTYLTFGWKYKERALRNGIPTELKEEILIRQFPRFVWVTEFSLASETYGQEPSDRRVRAHVVLDATGNRFGESAMVVDVPGLAVLWSAAPGGDIPQRSLIARITSVTGGYFSKIRGVRSINTALQDSQH